MQIDTIVYLSYFCLSFFTRSRSVTLALVFNLRVTNFNYIPKVDIKHFTCNTNNIILVFVANNSAI